jgi:hypothetical protein
LNRFRQIHLTDKQLWVACSTTSTGYVSGNSTCLLEGHGNQEHRLVHTGSHIRPKQKQILEAAEALAAVVRTATIDETAADERWATLSSCFDLRASRSIDIKTPLRCTNFNKSVEYLETDPLEGVGVICRRHHEVYPSNAHGKVNLRLQISFNNSSIGRFTNALFCSVLPLCFRPSGAQLGSVISA